MREGAKKGFLEMTDDNEDMPSAEFVGSLVAMAPQHFGSGPANPTFVFHSITGLAEKAESTEAYLPEEPVQPKTCTGNDNEVTNGGAAGGDRMRLPDPRASLQPRARSGCDGSTHRAAAGR